jgi:hypothetical protein
MLQTVIFISNIEKCIRVVVILFYYTRILNPNGNIGFMDMINLYH